MEMNRELSRSKKTELLKQRRKKLLWVFGITFLGLFVFFSWVASIITPKMGNPILDGSEDNLDVTSSEFKARVDNRLRYIQMQDTSPNGNQNAVTGVQIRPITNENKTETQASTQDPFNKSQDQDQAQKQNSNENQNNYNDNSDEEYNQTQEEEYNQPKQVQQAAPQRPPAPPVPVLRPKIDKQANAMIKVLIGSYQTKVEAQKAADKLASSVLNDRPYVKEINGRYVLQAGSFQNTGAARDLADELEGYNLYVRIVKD